MAIGPVMNGRASKVVSNLFVDLANIPPKNVLFLYRLSRKF